MALKRYKELSETKNEKDLALRLHQIEHNIPFNPEIREFTLVIFPIHWLGINIPHTLFIVCLDPKPIYS